jgi:methylmalonyl-CoA mutase cobalamin-binding domain/chain
MGLAFKMNGHGNRAPEVIERFFGARNLLPRWQFRDWRQCELSCSDGVFDSSDQRICATILLSCDDNRKSLLCQPTQDAARTIFNKFRPCSQGLEHLFYQELAVANEFEDDLDLNTLNDEELTEQVHDDLYNGLREEVVEATNILLGRGWTAARVLDDALVEGMRIVGVDFRDGILFVPEVLLAANAMKGGMEILRPLLAETGVEPIGKMVIGTVKGDIHDIGKNLVGMMMEGAGFEVIDLGINNPVEKYLAAIEEHKPDILGLSALLTTTMPYMKVVIDTLKEKGIRNDYIVLVGGAPLNEEFGKAVGADAYCRDAGIAVETAKTLIAARRAAAAA